VVADDGEGSIGGAVRVDVDELVMVAEDNDVTIHWAHARHVPHGMPALAFQVDGLVDPSPHRAVQELCAFAREDNTSNHDVLALHNMPIQIQDGSISHCDGPRGTIQVVLQLKPAAWPEDIPALNIMGVCWGRAAERDPESPEQDDHTTGSLTPPPFDCAGMLRQHLSLVC
jgi:hypothetical protein